jgi:hypothetical protein
MMLANNNTPIIKKIQSESVALPLPSDSEIYSEINQALYATSYPEFDIESQETMVPMPKLVKQNNVEENTSYAIIVDHLHAHNVDDLYEIFGNEGKVSYINIIEHWVSERIAGIHKLNDYLEYKSAVIYFDHMYHNSDNLCEFLDRKNQIVQYILPDCHDDNDIENTLFIYKSPIQ